MTKDDNQQDERQTTAVVTVEGPCQIVESRGFEPGETVRQYLVRQAPWYIERVDRIIDSEDIDPKVRLDALKMMMERILPTVHLRGDITPPSPVERMTDQEVKQYIMDQLGLHEPKSEQED